jgi:hypothetical protein
MTEKQIYSEQLAAQMRSAGIGNWLSSDKQDICELAGLYEKWLDTVTKIEEDHLAIKAAAILGVEIGHYEFF